MFLCIYVMNGMHNVDSTWFWSCMKLVSFVEHDIGLNCYVWWWIHRMLCYIKYKHYIWSLFYFTWLCGVMGLHMSNALVGLEWNWEYGLVCCDDMNSCTWKVDMTLWWWFFCIYEHVLMLVFIDLYMSLCVHKRLSKVT